MPENVGSVALGHGFNEQIFFFLFCLKVGFVFGFCFALICPRKCELMAFLVNRPLQKTLSVSPLSSSSDI